MLFGDRVEFLDLATQRRQQLQRRPRSRRRDRAREALAGRSEARVERVLAGLPSTRSWEGTLEYKLPCGATFAARTTLRYVAKRDTGLVRVALNAADTRAARRYSVRSIHPKREPIGIWSKILAR